MRRCILAPVIVCILVIGLIGTEYGHAAQAQAGGKKKTDSVASKEEKASKKAQAKTETAIATKKPASSKRKIKSKHTLTGNTKQSKKTDSVLKGSHTKTGKADGLSAVKKKKSSKSAQAKKRKRSRTQTLKAHARHSRAVEIASPIEEYQLPSPAPSDLWLARDYPDTYKDLLNIEEPQDLTLKILKSAYSCIGAPYRHGGTTPEGFDCSGFVRYVYLENGIRLGRSSRDQAQEGRPVQLSEVRPGDLIFFSMNSRNRDRIRIDHVGLYVGNGRFIHASGNRRAPEIRVEGLESKDYLPKVVEIRRILGEEQRVSSGLPY